MSWWAVYSEPGRALYARDELAGAGLGVLCPVEQLTRRRKVPNRNRYRAETVISPVFGRYLFAQGDCAEVLAVRGVFDVVRRGREAQAVPDEVVGALRSLTCAVSGVGDLMGRRDLTRLSLGFKAKEGDVVRFVDGGFSGYMGVIGSLAQLDSSGNVQVYLNIFGALRQTVVPHNYVGPVVGVGSDHFSERQVSAA